MKKISNKKWHNGLFPLIFWGSFIFFIIIGIWGFFYEDDMPILAFLWAGFVAFVYWLIRSGKIRTIIIRGFISGLLIGFVFLYIFHKIHPEEDVAGIAIISLLLCGLFFSIMGYLIQKFFWEKNKND